MSGHQFNPIILLGCNAFLGDGASELSGCIYRLADITAELARKTTYVATAHHCSFG